MTMEEPKPTSDISIFLGMMSPDPRNADFGVTPSSMVRDLSQVEPSSSVPQEIRHILERSRKLFLYSYLEYEFYSVAAQQVLYALEPALRTCLRRPFPKDKSSLKDLLGLALKKGLLPNRIPSVVTDSLRNLRNCGAHPSTRDIFLPHQAVQVYLCSVDLINCLFDECRRLSEPESFATKRKAREEFRQKLEAALDNPSEPDVDNESP